MRFQKERCTYSYEYSINFIKSYAKMSDVHTLRASIVGPTQPAIGHSASAKSEMEERERRKEKAAGATDVARL